MVEEAQSKDSFSGVYIYTLKESQVLIEQWRKEYNTVRPHSSPGYKPPAPETIALNYRERTKKEDMIHFGY